MPCPTLRAVTSTQRWQRYGNDRLYVRDDEGTRLGWVDLHTGARHVEDPAHADAVEQAARDWERRHTTSSTAPTPTTEDDVHPDAPGPDVAAAVGSSSRGRRPRPVAEGAAVLDELERGQGPVEGLRRGGGDDPRPATTAVPAADGRVPEDTGEWEDLAGRRPGAAAREQALAHRQAAPVRTVLRRVLGIHSDERAWRIGADGEEKVAAQLDKLVSKDPRWRVLHAVPVGDRGSDIDHVVIGPGGVFTLNAKHHPRAKVWVGGNTVLVDGARVPYVRNSRHEAKRAARLLSAACGTDVAVTGLVVVVGAEALTVKAQPDDVRVLARREVRGWLAGRLQALDEPGVDAVHAAARRAGTWRA